VNVWITSSSSTSVTCVASYLLTFDIITSRELISRLTRIVRRPVQYCHPPLAKSLPSRNSAVSAIGANVEPPEIRRGGTVMLVPVLLRPFQVATVANYVPVKFGLRAGSRSVFTWPDLMICQERRGVFRIAIMQGIAAVSKGAASFHRDVPSHLLHPLLGRMGGDPSDLYPSTRNEDVSSGPQIIRWWAPLCSW
jgi:hypothetical protein